MAERIGLRAHARRAARALRPHRATVRREVVAGVPGAISSVLDGMAAGILAGVNPVHGLYASIFGPVGGGLTSSSKLMVITTTSAAALAAGSVVAGVPAERRPDALFLLTLIARVLEAQDLRVVRLAPTDAGVGPDVLAQMRRNRTVEHAGKVWLYEATSVVGEASLEACHDAEAWLASRAVGLGGSGRTP